ncbi:MAG: outer membrane protein assembly factor BamB family protein [Phycisphaerales bacterium]
MAQTKTRTARVLLGVLAAGAAVAPTLGCKSTSDGSASGAGGDYAPLVEADGRVLTPYERMGFRIEWKGYPVLSRGRQPMFVDVFGDRVVFQDTGNTVTVMDASTGRNIWASEIDNPTTRFIGNARKGDTLFSASDNELFELDIKTGNILERHNLAVVCNTGPVIMGDIAVFGGAAGQILGHNLASTYKQWGYQMNGVITSVPVEVSGLIGVVSQRGEVVFVDPERGSSTAIGSIYSGLVNNPVAGDGALFIASTDQSVYAFSPNRSEPMWRVRTAQPLVEQPTFIDGRLYVHVPGEGMTQFAAGSGAKLWQNPEVSGRVLGMVNGRLVSWDGSRLVLLDPDRGDIIDSVELGNVFDLVMSAPVDGDLYAVQRDGWIEKHSPRR